MSTTAPHPSFPVSLFTQLARRLRYANARYDLIAYQCRNTRRPTYHAKRRAYHAGLRIDTSKACAGWPDAQPDLLVSDSAASSTDRTAGGPAWAADEVEAGIAVGEDALPNPWPEPRVVQKQSATPRCLSLSPLGLELRNVDDVDACALPVPGAPRRWSKPLPDDDPGCDRGREGTTKASSPEAACTYNPVWRGVIRTHASSVWMSVDGVYGNLGVTVPRRHLKRKLRDVDAERSVKFCRRTGVGMFEDTNRFSKGWWSRVA